MYLFQTKADINFPCFRTNHNWIILIPNKSEDVLIVSIHSFPGFKVENDTKWDINKFVIGGPYIIPILIKLHQTYFDI